MKKNVILRVLLLTCLLSLISCVRDLSDYTYVLQKDTTQAYAEREYAPVKMRALLDEQERKMITYFTDGAEQTTCMARNSTKDYSLGPGNTGFGFMNIICGVERGWIARQEGAERILKATNFLKSVNRHNGVWGHWYNKDGLTIPFGNQVDAGELVETAYFIMGLLAAEEYFNLDNETENKIRVLAEELFNSVDWSSHVVGDKLYWIRHYNKAGTSEEYELPITGWNETLITYILALAAPEGHNISPSLYNACWKRGNYYHPGDKLYGYPIVVGNQKGDPLFLFQYAFAALNPKQLGDDQIYMWTAMTNNIMAGRHYCLYEAPKEYAYSAYDWGLTACTGAGSTPDYKSRSPRSDDGVIAPTAAISSMPFTPFYTLQMMKNFCEKYPSFCGAYGIASAYKPSEKQYNPAYLGCEHGPQAIMIENYRSGLIWSLMMRNKHIQDGLRMAGIGKPNYSQGFYTAIPDIQTGAYDMVCHPDREVYEVDYCASTNSKADLTIFTSNGQVVYKSSVNLSAGPNVISFFDPVIPLDVLCTLTIQEGQTVNSLNVIFR